VEDVVVDGIAGAEHTVREDVWVRVAALAGDGIDFTLQPGQTTETVVVSVEAPLIDTTSSTNTVVPRQNSLCAEFSMI
jgi:hypothetical protein